MFQPYLSMMSAMVQANICRPSGSCKATGNEEKATTQITFATEEICHLKLRYPITDELPLLFHAAVYAGCDISW